MRTTFTDFRSATAMLRTIASQHPDLAEQLLPIADLLNLHADVIALGHAVDEHGSLIAAKMAADPRVGVIGAVGDGGTYPYHDHPDKTL